jgi:glycosyltransferase involved in cell wall biosynthesis
LLFIADGALDRPLLHSQGLPLLRRMAELGIKCFVLSFETTVAVKESALGQDLAERGIVWEVALMSPQASAWQRVQMIITGCFQAWRLCQRESIELVHCRSYRPAIMGALLKKISGCKFVFDMRGFLIDELIAAGRWQAGTLKERLARLVEGACVLAADALITTSTPFRNRLLFLFPKIRPEQAFSIPNCVDTYRFKFDSQLRHRVRSALGWDGRMVLIFAGDSQRYLQTMGYLLNFFAEVCKWETKALLVLLVYGETQFIESIVGQSSLAANIQLVPSAPSSEMPAYLSAADVGLAFLRATNPALAITNPIKFAEYLACGLPAVINPEIGDTALIVETYRVGSIVDPENPIHLELKVKELLNLLRESDLRQRCRLAAEKELSLDLAVERYRQVYETVAFKAQSRGR